MAKRNEAGEQQFTSKDPITTERFVTTLKNGRWGQRKVTEQVEFAWDESRKAVIVNPFFKQPVPKK